MCQLICNENNSLLAVTSNGSSLDFCHMRMSVYFKECANIQHVSSFEAAASPCPASIDVKLIVQNKTGMSHLLVAFLAKLT